MDDRGVEADDKPARARLAEVVQILAAAEERDAKAELRDVAADEREQVDSLHSFLNDPLYGATLKARRAAATDRLHAKTDRAAGASDRATLSSHFAPPTDQGMNG